MSNQQPEQAIDKPVAGNLRVYSNVEHEHIDVTGWTLAPSVGYYKDQFGRWYIVDTVSGYQWINLGETTKRSADRAAQAILQWVKGRFDLSSPVLAQIASGDAQAMTAALREAGIKLP